MPKKYWKGVGLNLSVEVSEWRYIPGRKQEENVQVTAQNQKQAHPKNKTGESAE